MRRFLLLALTLVPMLSMAQDDLYFTSSKKEKEAAQKRRQTTSVQMRPVTTAPPATVDYQSNHRSEDEYNRLCDERRKAVEAQNIADQQARIDRRKVIEGLKIIIPNEYRDLYNAVNG